MAGSKRYGELLYGVRKLRNALLPAKFDPTGSYRSAERVHLRAVSFRILVHAEVESFLEDRALELFDSGWKAWEHDNVPNRVVTALLAFSGVATALPPGKLGGDPANQKAYEDLKQPVQKAQAVWRAAHRDNHGVKEANVLALLLPLGIAHGELDTTLLADLTSFGADRGAVAHRSSVQVGQYSDPQAEKQRADQLVANLLGIDVLIDSGIQEVRVLEKAIARKNASAP